jgi:alpha-L-rhamnosidase
MPGGKLACLTQTAHVLALHFHLGKPRGNAASLVKMIMDDGTHLTTGFVGNDRI